MAIVRTGGRVGRRSLFEGFAGFGFGDTSTSGAATFAFRTSNGNYVSAESGGGREVVANRTAIGPWESFGIVDLTGSVLRSGDKIQLRVSNGQFVCAENGGGGAGAVNANRSSPADWETFTIVAPGAAVTVDGFAYWQGADNFYFYNGTVSPTICAANGPWRASVISALRIACS
jgi:hypothetical protein